MPYLATLCDGCRRAQLITATDFHGTPTCRRCGGSLRVVPSRSYAGDDTELFDELGDTIAEARVSPEDARQLGAEIERAIWAQQLPATFERLSRRLPGILPIQVACGNNAAAQLRALQMLKTICDGLATSRPRA